MKNRISRGIKRIKNLLGETGKNIAIITHVNPDGDAIGSCLALGRVLSSAGHKSGMIAPNVYPSFLKWMPGDDEIIVFNNAQKKGRQVIKEADIIFCIDFNDLSRVKLINELVDQSDAVKVLIDHHPTENYFGDVIFCDTDASSTAELIFEFIRIMGYRNNIDAETATCIFAGIMTDTGCFSYNSSNPRTYEIIASLLEYGFNKDQVYYNVYDNFSGDRMRLLGHILNDKMEIYEEFHTDRKSVCWGIF